jgi:hypothetical protein
MPTTQSERETLHQIAQEYEARGYRVILRPDSHQRPDFLRRFAPDLLALSDRENVVVEVRERGSLRRMKQFDQLANLVNDQPGWRYRCIVAPRPESNGLEGQKTLTPAQIRAALESAEQLSLSKNYQAAFLSAWTALEATLRARVAREDVTPGGNTGIALIKAAHMAGLIDETEYKCIADSYGKRNALVHGFEAGRVTRNDVKRVCAFAHELLA